MTSRENSARSSLQRNRGTRSRAAYYPSSSLRLAHRCQTYIICPPDSGRSTRLLIGFLLFRTLPPLRVRSLHLSLRGLPLGGWSHQVVAIILLAGRPLWRVPPRPHPLAMLRLRPVSPPSHYRIYPSDLDMFRRPLFPTDRPRCWNLFQKTARCRDPLGK